MEEIIISIIVASGVLGILSNFLVSAIKWVANNWNVSATPRIWNALASLSGALGVVLMGGEADHDVIGSSLTVLVIALVSYTVAHFTHKMNKI